MIAFAFYFIPAQGLVTWAQLILKWYLIFFLLRVVKNTNPPVVLMVDMNLFYASFLSSQHISIRVFAVLLW